MKTNRLLNVAGLARSLVYLSVLAQLAHMLPTQVGAREDSIKYILIWGNPNLYPSRTMGNGSSAFIQHECEYTNCFVTGDKKYLNNVMDFDAIIFNGRELNRKPPEKRLPRQKYVYANMESSHNYPVCDNRFNNFFNWTWTYKLNSDAWWGYIRVHNLSGNVVGPKIDMHWSEMEDVGNETQMLLQNKSVAAAWFVSNCHAKSGRSKFVNETTNELAKYGHSIHIFGKCGKFKCPRSQAERCNKMIAKDYFFYLAFENSFAEDYVTEKVLTGLKNNAVPVVFGEANYSRFLPPGSYLDARELGPEGLAQRMASIISRYKSGQPDAYYDFFRWRSRYIIHEITSKEVVCKMCWDLNNPELLSRQTIYKNFTNWWNSKYAKCNAKTVKSVRNGDNCSIGTIAYGAVKIMISIGVTLCLYIMTV